MVVKLVHNEFGQSIFEFLVMLPMLFGMVVILFKINSAIQISIVNQQYARSHTLFLAYNSPYYPTLNHQQTLIQTGMNYMLIGVSDNSVSANYKPKASVQNIARKRNAPASDASQEEPSLRAKVRIRTTVTLCTQSLFFTGRGGGSIAVLPLEGSPIKASSVSQLTEDNAVELYKNPCAGKVKYEQ